MYTVKQTDENSIEQATKLADERSKRLADTIKDILALKGDEKLSVKTIEQAIDIVEGRKKPTDLIPCQAIKGISFVRPEDKMIITCDRDEFFNLWEKPKQFILYLRRAFERPKATHWNPSGVDVCVHMMDVSNYLAFKSRGIRHALEEERISRNLTWDYFFKDFVLHSNLMQDEPYERRMQFARDR